MDLDDFQDRYRHRDPEDLCLVDEEFGRVSASKASTAADQVLYPDLVRLLRIIESLAAACMLATVLAGCASPASTDRHDAISSALSPAERAEAAGPRFAKGGPDAVEYGARQSYPMGYRSTYSRVSFLVGSYSHLDQIFEGRLIRRAATPSPLARAPSEPAVRYEYEGQTFTLDDYLARNPATGLLVARGDTILIERYQYARRQATL